MELEFTATQAREMAAKRLEKIDGERVYDYYELCLQRIRNNAQAGMDRVSWPEQPIDTETREIVSARLEKLGYECGSKVNISWGHGAVINTPAAN